MNSRQAINLLKGLEQSLDDYCELNDEGKAAFRMAIEALELFGNAEQLPSAQPEQRWIPCSERLPEDYTVVLVYTSVGGYFTAYFDGICWYHAGLHMMRIYSDVVAWMPLPKPYDAESEDEE